VALFGSVLIFAGGLLFATAEFSYADLGGAARLDSFRWIWQLLGLAYFFVGLGIFLGLAGLESGLPTWGGGIAFVGGLLEAIQEFAYAALVGTVPYSQLAWTDQLGGLGFFLIMVGLVVGFGGLAAARPRRMAGILAYNPNPERNWAEYRPPNQ